MPQHDPVQTKMEIVGLVVGLGTVAALFVAPMPGPNADRPIGKERSGETVVLDTQTATPPTDDLLQVLRERSRQYARCHEDLVRAQDRLRRLGHEWSDELRTWVRAR